MKVDQNPVPDNTNTQENITHTTPDYDPDFFNKKIVCNFPVISHILTEKKGFESVYFPASDGKKLHAFLRKSPQARATIIVYGMDPARQFPFVELINKTDYNLLLVHSRGTGYSSGGFYTSLAQTGDAEYCDILGTLTYVNQRFNKPDIIIIGLCAGAVYSIRALTLVDKNMSNIKGLIADSAWNNLSKVSWILMGRELEDFLKRVLFNGRYKTLSRHKLRQNKIFSLCYYGSCTVIYPLYFIFLKPLYKLRTAKTRIEHYLTQLDIPIFFIHGIRDDYPLSDIKTIAENYCHSECWWIDSSDHTWHHVRDTASYSKRLNDFLQRCLIDTHTQ